MQRGRALDALERIGWQKLHTRMNIKDAKASNKAVFEKERGSTCRYDAVEGADGARLQTAPLLLAEALRELGGCRSNRLIGRKVHRAEAGDPQRGDENEVGSVKWLDGDRVRARCLKRAAVVDPETRLVCKGVHRLAANRTCGEADEWLGIRPSQCVLSLLLCLRAESQIGRP